MVNKRRRTQAPHNGKINLYALVHFDNLFVSKSGHLWSTAREGLRQRKFTRWKGMLQTRVSCKGHQATFTAGSLWMLALIRDWRVHWDGTKIVQGWMPDLAGDTGGDGPSAIPVDDRA